MSATAPSRSIPAAVGLDGGEIAALGTTFRGSLVGREDPAYDAARRVFNAMHDRHPSLVIRAADVADVIAAVRLARERGLPLAVRGGGHSVPGYGTVDDGIVLDLGALRGIRVDPPARRARAEGGTTWGDLNHATHPFGLATTGGAVSTTGIGGLTLGGGLGHLARTCGLAADNLVSADVVTADGELLTASRTEHPDLLWALRGGGGNFGVVTSFEYRLHRVSEILGGPILFEPDARVIAGYRDFIREAPEAFGGIFALIQAPPLPFLDERWHGRFVAAVVVCWTGDPVEGERQVRRVRSLGSVIGEHVGPMPYPVINTLFDELQPAGLHNYWKSHVVHDLPDAAIDVHLEHASRVPNVWSGTYFFPLNGAVHHPPEPAAFPHRDALFSVGLFGMWPDPADNEPNVAWVREYDAATARHADASGYVNFISPAPADRTSAIFGEGFERLREIKRRYDPDNLFRVNANIPPD